MKVPLVDVMKRRNEILRIIQKQKKVSVACLSDKFFVSHMTIRRDLQYWADKGAIVRRYGGAYFVEEFLDDLDYDKKRILNAIAKKASIYIQNGDIIFINSSDTALRILSYIKHKKVTVITNNAKAINYTPDSKITVILTGGELRYPKHSMVGDCTTDMLKKITANKCLIGCSGITDAGIYTELPRELEINKAMIARTDGQCFVLCDYSKFGLQYSHMYATFDEIDYLITDNSSDSEILCTISSLYNTEIIVTSPIVNL